MPTQQTPTIPAAPTDLQTFGSTVVTSANQLSAAGTSMTALVQTARISSLKRAASAAVSTYGADSTEATAANQVVTTAQAKTGPLQIVSQKASTTPPSVASDGWTLHGRVYDANLNPQERYTVFLGDEQKNYISDYGFCTTDSTGYFLIQYPGASAAGSSTSSKSRPASPDKPRASSRKDEELIVVELDVDAEPDDRRQSSKASRSSSPKTAPASSTPTQAFIQVCDANANPVLSSSTPFTPVTGQGTYQVLTLPASGQSLGDLPAEIQAVAMPPIKSKATKKSTKSSDPGTS